MISFQYVYCAHQHLETEPCNNKCHHNINCRHSKTETNVPSDDIRIGEATPKNELVNCKYCTKKVRHEDYDNYWLHENGELFCKREDRIDYTDDKSPYVSLHD